MCKVIAVTNRKLCRGDFLERIRMLGRAGVDQIVLREKDLEESAYEELSRKVLAACQDFVVKCSLHQYIGAAKRLGARNLHLSLPLAVQNKQELGHFDWFGISVHSLGQLREAQDCGVDYIFYGHVFATDCKKGVPPRGLDALRGICKAAEVPVYAIGGISPENAIQAAEAGADGVCVMSWGMQQKEEVVRAFVEKCHGIH